MKTRHPGRVIRWLAHEIDRDQRVLANYYTLCSNRAQSETQADSSWDVQAATIASMIVVDTGLNL